MTVQSRGVFLLVTTLMSSIALVASDICIPALPQMATYFDCSSTEIQMSFTLFLLVLGLCQLIYGSLSDRFGRKNILIMGFSLFILASYLCAISTSLSEFLCYRVLQAVGGGVGSVLTRAIVADRFDRLEAVKIFTTIFPIVGLSPALSPLIGGYLTHLFDWRSTFIAMVVFGIIALVLILLCLDEKKRPNLQEQTFAKKQYGYSELFKNFEFLGYAFIVCTGYSAFRCYTTESPFVFDNQGYVSHEMGYFYITLSVTYVIGNLIAKRLISKIMIEKVLRVGMSFFVLGGVGMVLGTLFFPESPLSIIVPMSLVTFGNGFLFPVGSAAAMASVPSAHSGTASGLLGSLQLGFAALTINWIGEICGGQAFWMSLYLIFIIMFGLLSYFFVVYGAKERGVRMDG